MRTWTLLFGLTLLGPVVTRPVHSQTSFPMITHTTPTAVQRGTSVTVMVEGQMNFARAHHMLTLGGGIQAEVLADPAPKAAAGAPAPLVRSVRLRLTIAPDAELGVREFRLATALGISSLGQLLVVDEPVVSESGVNNTPAQANPVAVPSIVCGRIEALEDVDSFRFTAKAGQRLTFEVFCARLQDKIHDLQKHADPLVTLLDSEGREIGANDDSLFADPLMSIVIPRDGTYTVQIRDAKYDGDPRWAYALRITDRPFATHLFPMAGNPGQRISVEPVGPAKASHPKLPLVVPTRLGLQEIQLDVGGRLSNPVAFYVTELPCVMEQEPNDTPSQATPVSIPCAINGRIATRRDNDCFRFKGVKGQALRVEVKARRFGTSLRSSLDSILEILSPTGTVVASNDDESGKDAGLVFTPAVDGEFVVRLRDLNSKGGDAAVYCLELSVAKPDYSLRCDPGKAMIGPGSSTAWYIQVARVNGFAGPVEVRVDGLPPGVSASPLTIPATMTQGLILLTAEPGAKIGASMARVLGRAMIDSKPLDHDAIVSEEIYSPGGGRARFDASMHAVAVTETSDIVAVDVSPREISLKPGQEVRIDVTIKRRPDYDKAVSLDVLLRHLGTVFGNPLPPGVTLVEGKSKTLLGTGNTGHIVLQAAPNAAPIENVPISVLAHVSINFVVKISYSSPVIPVSVRK